MIDGTYKIAVNVPFGRRDGTVALHTEGDAVFADIDAPVIGKQRLEGRCEGNSFTAAGAAKIKLVGKLDYTLKGQVAGDKLQIEITSSKGDYKLEGIRK